jgi:hypothetical protein
LRVSPPGTASEDFSEFAGAGVPSMMFNIGVYDQERIDAARNGGPPIPSNHSPQFAPVPKPTIETGITAMTLARAERLRPEGQAKRNELICRQDVEALPMMRKIAALFPRLCKPCPRVYIARQRA